MFRMEEEGSWRADIIELWIRKKERKLFSDIEKKIS